MLMTAHDAQEIQFIVNQIERCNAFRNDNFVIDFDEAKHEATIHNAQKIENEKGQTRVQWLCHFDVGIVESNNFGCHQMDKSRQIVGELMRESILP